MANQRVWWSRRKAGREGTHRDEGPCVGYKARVLLKPLLQVLPPGSVVSGQPCPIFEVDDRNPAFCVHWALTLALGIARHRGHRHAHLANATPPRGYLEMHGHTLVRNDAIQ